MSYFPEASYGIQQQGRTLSPPWLARQQNNEQMGTESPNQHAYDRSPTMERENKRQRTESPNVESPRMNDDEFMPMHPPCIQRLALPSLLHLPSDTAAQPPQVGDTVARSRIRTFRQSRC